MDRLRSFLQELRALGKESRLFSVALVGTLLLHAVQVMDIVPSWYWYARWCFGDIAGFFQTLVSVLIVQTAAFYIAWTFRHRLMYNMRRYQCFWRGRNLLSCGIALLMTLAMEVLHLWTYWADNLSTIGKEPFKLWQLGYGAAWHASGLVFALSLAFPILGVLLTFITAEEEIYTEEEESAKSKVLEALGVVSPAEAKQRLAAAAGQPPQHRGKKGDAFAHLHDLVAAGRSVEEVLAYHTVAVLIREWGVAKRTAQQWRAEWAKEAAG